ncbi:hypothetical protein GCM10022243_32330 [Saccharothrix violaceirubra]
MVSESRFICVPDAGMAVDRADAGGVRWCRNRPAVVDPADTDKHPARGRTMAFTHRRYDVDLASYGLTCGYDDPDGRLRPGESEWDRPDIGKAATARKSVAAWNNIRPRTAGPVVVFVCLTGCQGWVSEQIRWSPRSSRVGGVVT